MPKSLIDRLHERLQTPERRVQMWSGRGKPKLPPPAAESAVAKAETALGFKLPELLRRFYLELANGGFGLGYGLVGISPNGSKDDIGRDLLALYQVHRGDCADWPERLLPICHEGCAYYFCADAAKKSCPILTFDTTAYFVDEEPWPKSIRRVSPSLRRWLSDWVES